jgi:hypothetical protein
MIYASTRLITNSKVPTAATDNLDLEQVSFNANTISFSQAWQNVIRAQTEVDAVAVFTGFSEFYFEMQQAFSAGLPIAIVVDRALRSSISLEIRPNPDLNNFWSAQELTHQICSIYDGEAVKQLTAQSEWPCLTQSLGKHSGQTSTSANKKVDVLLQPEQAVYATPYAIYFAARPRSPTALLTSLAVPIVVEQGERLDRQTPASINLILHKNLTSNLNALGELFQTIAKPVAAHNQANPNKKLLSSEPNKKAAKPKAKRSPLTSTIEIIKQNTQISRAKPIAALTTELPSKPEHILEIEARLKQRGILL